MAATSMDAPKPLSAAEITAHPAFQTNEWSLPPTQSGNILVANNRSGGPFNLWYEVHGTGPKKLIVSVISPFPDISM